MIVELEIVLTDTFTKTFLLGCAKMGDADTNEQVGLEGDAGMRLWWTTRPSA